MLDLVGGNPASVLEYHLSLLIREITVSSPEVRAGPSMALRDRTRPTWRYTRL